DHPVTRHVAQHGDGVKTLALWVDDARASWEETTKRGAVSVQEPTVLTDEHGEVVIASIQTYGETVHTFVERKNYRGAFMPGFQPMDDGYVTEETGLLYVDHCVGNVELGQMNTWVKFYQ